MSLAKSELGDGFVKLGKGEAAFTHERTQVLGENEQEGRWHLGATAAAGTDLKMSGERDFEGPGLQCRKKVRRGGLVSGWQELTLE